MKFNFLFLFLILICSFNANSQNSSIIGIDCNEGTYGKGRIFQIDSPYTHIQTKHSFEYKEGYAPYINQELTLAPNGKYYGISFQTDRDRSVVFELDRSNNTYQIVYEFDETIFVSPGSFIIHPNGLIYGYYLFSMTHPNAGMYSLDLQTKTLTTLSIISGAYGYPFKNLILGSNNKIYGTTGILRNGSNYGSLYSYDIATDSVVFEHFFTGWFRSNSSQLVEGPNNNIYGIREGNYPFYGRLFRFNYSSNTYTTLLEIDSRNNYPQQDYVGLALHNNTLFTSSCTFASGPSAFNSALMKINLGANSAQVAGYYPFNDSLEGRHPRGNLKVDSNQNVLGILYKGGPNDAGSMFISNLSLNNVQIKTPFDQGKRLYNPSGYFTSINSSTIIGFTANEPVPANSGNWVNKYAHGVGAIYEYNYVLDSIKAVVNFGESPLGHVPTNNIVDAGNGIYYLATQRGANYYAGSILKYDFNTNAISMLHEVDSTSLNQINSMVLHNNKLICLGTSNQYNKILEYDLTTQVFSVIDSLSHPKPENSIDQYNLFKASNGKLYFVNQFIHQPDSSVLYSYNPVSKALTEEFILNSRGIVALSQDFVEVNQKLYSTFTQNALHGNGVMAYDLVTGGVNLITNYNSTPISQNASLTLHSNGKMYAIVTDHLTPTNIIEFDPTNISNPFNIKARINNDEMTYAGRMLEINGELYFQIASHQFYNYSNKDSSLFLAYNPSTNAVRRISSVQTNSNCFSLNNWILLNNSTTSIAENKKTQWSVYPNPAKDQIFLSKAIQENRLIVYNLKGQVMLEQEDSGNSIDVSKLANGIYFLEIQTEKRTERLKVVVSR